MRMNSFCVSLVSTAFLSGFLLKAANADTAPKVDLNNFVFPEMVTGFEVQGKTGESFFIGVSGQSWNVDSAGVSLGSLYTVAPECVLKSQWANFLNQGMTFNGTFFVGMDRVCFKDESSKSIRKVADFKLSNLDFSLSYLSESKEFTYFLANGKGPNPAAEDGYLTLVTLSSSDFTVSTRTLVTDVYGYSAGMHSNPANGKFMVTYSYGDAESSADSLPKNELWEINTPDLLNLVSANSTANFVSIAKQIIPEIRGLTFSLSQNDKGFVYQNFDTGGANFVIQKSDFAKKVLDSDCNVINGMGAQWLSLCKGNSLTVSDF